MTPPFPWNVIAAIRRWYDHRTEAPTYLQQLHAVWTAPTVRPAARMTFRNLSVVRSTSATTKRWSIRGWLGMDRARPSKPLRKIA